MTDLEIEVDREIRNLIGAMKVAEDIAEAAAQAAKVAQDNAMMARRAVEQALSAAAHRGVAFVVVGILKTGSNPAERRNKADILVLE